MKVLLILLLCLQLGACGFLSRTEPEPTLSDLEPVRLPESGAELPSVSLEQQGVTSEPTVARDLVQSWLP